METEIKILQPNHVEELIELISVFENVFEMKDFEMPGENYLQQLLEKDSFFCFRGFVTQ